MAERRGQLHALARRSGSGSARRARTRGAAGRTSGSSTRRTTAGTTSSSATSCGGTTRSACTSTSGIRGADRAVAVCNALRNFLPELLALSASSPFVEDVDSGLHSARTQIFTRMFPRCGVPDAYDGWSGVRAVRPLPLRHGLDRRAHADLVERAPAPRVPDGRDPHLRRAARPRRGAVARRARSTRSPRGSRARTTRASRSDLPHRLIEENLWRAIRYGLSGELIDLDDAATSVPRARGSSG